MILTIGRIIHVIESSVVDRCIAAIVTGIAYAPPPYGQGQPLTIYMTVFPPHGARDDAARRVVLAQDSPHWHDPRECPLAPLLTNAGGGGSGGIDRVRVAPDHPQDGYAYDGCTCDRCIAIRGAGEA